MKNGKQFKRKTICYNYNNTIYENQYDRNQSTTTTELQTTDIVQAHYLEYGRVGAHFCESLTLPLQGTVGPTGQFSLLVSEISHSGDKISYLIKKTF